MSRNKLLTRLAFLIFLILALHLGATVFYWYSSLWWFDMLLHFLGGVWLFLALVWLLGIREFNFKSIFKIMFLLLVVGVLWELYEIVVNDTITRNPFNLLDTSLDLFFDLLGGAVAMLFFRKTMPIKGAGVSP